MYTIRSDSPRSRRCIDFIFDPAVLKSEDEPTSIFDAKMKDRNHDINRTIGVSKIFLLSIQISYNNCTIRKCCDRWKDSTTKFK